MQPAIKQISLSNTNNKLMCNAFVVINKPPVTPFTTMNGYQVYSIKHDSSSFLATIVNVLEVPFLKVGDWYTLPATGLKEGDWRRQWMKENPDTTDKTLIGIYYYLKLYT